MTKTMNYGAAVATIAAFLSLTAALPAFADYNDSEIDVDLDNDVKVSVVNSAFVVNSTTASASTGGNWAGGSYGGDGAEGGKGGYGGDAEADADADADYGDADADADANGGYGGEGGEGGNGGAGGAGGTVATGDAEANAGTMNVINSTDIKVEGCGCDADLDDVENFDDVDYDADNEVKIEVLNSGALVNITDAYAKTGWNWADGSFGGDGANAGDGSTGGDADADADADANDEGDANADAEADGGSAGAGGAGGEGGEGGAGGLIVTGHATTNSGTVNLINSLLIRVVR